MAISDFIEMHEDTAEEEYTTEESSAVRRFKGPWKDRVAFVASILGTRIQIGGTILSTNPGTYPDLPFLYCISVSLKKVGIATGTSPQASFSEAIVIAKYNTLSYSPTNANGTQAYMTEDWDFASQFFSLDGSFYSWTEGPNKDEFLTNTHRTIGKQIGLIDMGVVLHRTSFVPSAAILGAIGKVNKDLFTLPVSKTVIQPGWLLLNGCSISRSVDFTGAGLWSINYQFHYREEQWNKVMDEDGEWYAVTPKINKEAPFSGLLTAA